MPAPETPLVEERGPVTLTDLLHYHANESDACTAEEKPFHEAAVKLLGETLQLAAQTMDGMLEVRLDALVGPGKVVEGYKTIRLPNIPLPGETLTIDGERVGVQARAHEVNGGAYTCCLLVGRVVQGPGIVPAGADALSRLPPSIIRPGHG